MRKKLIIVLLFVITTTLFLGFGYAATSKTITGKFSIGGRASEVKLYFVNTNNLTPSITSNVHSSNYSFSFNEFDNDLSGYGLNGKYSDTFELSLDSHGKADDEFNLSIPFINLSNDLNAGDLNVSVNGSSELCNKIFSFNNTIKSGNDYSLDDNYVLYSLYDNNASTNYMKYYLNNNKVTSSYYAYIHSHIKIIHSNDEDLTCTFTYSLSGKAYATY